MGYYLNSQICLNGHVITDRLPLSEDHCVDFCPECSAKTIKSCPNCNEPIRGEFKNDKVIAIGYGKTPAPAYCFKCGERFPWTDEKIKSLLLILDEERRLPQSEREKLKKSLPDLIAQTPRTELAVFYFKKIITVVGKITEAAMLNFIATSCCAYVQSLFGL